MKIEKQVKNINKDKAREEMIKNLVMVRLESLPPGLKMSIGSYGELTKKEMINHLQDNDYIGQKIRDIHLNYLQAMKEGIFYEQELTNH